VIDSLRAESVVSLPDAQVEQDFAELQVAVEALEAERLRRLAEIDRRRLVERDGHLSTAAWLADRFGVAAGVARDAVRLARGLERMVRVRQALVDGVVSLSAVRVLAEVRDVEPAAFEVAETFLVEAATRLSISDLRRAVTHWRHVVEQQTTHGGGDDPHRARRHLHASVTLGGMVRVDGDLDPETGETFLTALRAVLDAEARSGAGVDDGRTPGQRRVDALGEICRRWLDRSDRPVVAGERPHLAVTVPVDSLLEGATPGELEHGGPLGAGSVRRLACDASITRVVFRAPSEPLDIGRRTPVVPPAIRRAVITRDRRCRFPGCDRPHAWCDAHHVVHWADGGATSLANLVLLCRRHHRSVHAGFTMEMIDGRPVFRRPDGSVLEDRGPPSLRI
jgi:hypothetical protein